MESEGSGIFCVIESGRQSSIDQCEEDYLDEGEWFCFVLCIGVSFT